MSAAPPPNWYPDPYDASQLRWWDGMQWTEHRHELVPATPHAEAARAASSDTARVATPSSEVGRAVGADTPKVDTPMVDSASTDVARESAIGAPRDAADQWARPATVLEPEAVDLERSAPQPMTSWDTPMLPARVPVQTPSSESRPVARPTPPARDRRPLLIALAAVAVVVIGALVFALTRGGDDTDAESPSTTGAIATTAAPSTTSASPSTTAATTTAPATTAPTTTAPLAGTVFTDATNVYRLRVAPTWSDATTAGGLQTWATGTGSTVFRDSVNVLIEKLPGDISMDDYLAASVRNAPRSLPSFAEVGRSVTNVNGKVLGQLDFRSNQQIPLRHRAVVVIKGRNAVVVTYSVQPERFDAEIAKVQPYLTSVEGV